VLRDILRGRLAPEPDPRGLRLRGARIAGRLDVDGLTTSVTLELQDCLLSEGLVAGGAKLPKLVPSGCRLEHPNRSPVDGRALRVRARRRCIGWRQAHYVKGEEDAESFEGNRFVPPRDSGGA
jgi:hypothetical protein